MMLLFSLLEVNDSFWADESMTARNSDDTGDGVPLAVLCVCLNNCIELRATSRYLFRIN